MMGKEKGGRRGDRMGHRDEGAPEFDQRTLDLARVTSVTKGGKRMRFRALVVAGDHKGRVGFGLAKGADVQIAVNKAGRKAQKAIVRIPLLGGTIPHSTNAKFGAAMVLLKPAPKGTGIKAGGATRAVLELLGVQNVVAKTLGSKNKINNVLATMKALTSLSLSVKERRGKTPAETIASPEADKASQTE